MLATWFPHFPNFPPSVPQFPHCPIPLSPSSLCFLYTSLNFPHVVVLSVPFLFLFSSLRLPSPKNATRRQVNSLPLCRFSYNFISFLSFLVLTDTREKYDGTRRSPWNEIECGDHYVRPMAAFLFFELASGQVGY